MQHLLRTVQYFDSILTGLTDALHSLLQGPSKQYALGLFPTPIHRWYPPGIPEDVEFWIKRDDLTGMQLSGNKVRLIAFISTLLTLIADSAL